MDKDLNNNLDFNYHNKPVMAKTSYIDNDDTFDQKEKLEPKETDKDRINKIAKKFNITCNSISI